jgi:hypothetical protein
MRVGVPASGQHRAKPRILVHVHIIGVFTRAQHRAKILVHIHTLIINADRGEARISTCCH